MSQKEGRCKDTTAVLQQTSTRSIHHPCVGHRDSLVYFFHSFCFIHAQKQPKKLVVCFNPHTNTHTRPGAWDAGWAIITRKRHLPQNLWDCGKDMRGKMKSLFPAILGFLAVLVLLAEGKPVSVEEAAVGGGLGEKGAGLWRIVAEDDKDEEDDAEDIESGAQGD